MCIRDRANALIAWSRTVHPTLDETLALTLPLVEPTPPGDPCLLYTSDAADERSSVDLGGRRIIKKKNTKYDVVSGRSKTTHTDQQET